MTKWKLDGSFWFEKASRIRTWNDLNFFMLFTLILKLVNLNTFYILILIWNVDEV